MDQILGLLLEDGVRQQERMSTLKKNNTPITPFDMFGPVWGENGHKQSGDYENMKKAWEKSRTGAFGKGRMTLSFNAFWTKAIVDENGREYVFGSVVSGL